MIVFPVVMADYGGDWYLVSMLGENANWVRNVRAAGGRALIRHGEAHEVELYEVRVEKRALVLRRYLEVAPGARPHIPVDRSAPVEEFDRIAPGSRCSGSSVWARPEYSGLARRDWRTSPLAAWLWLLDQYGRAGQG